MKRILVMLAVTVSIFLSVFCVGIQSVFACDVQEVAPTLQEKQSTNPQQHSLNLQEEQFNSVSTAQTQMPFIALQDAANGGVFHQKKNKNISLSPWNMNFTALYGKNTFNYCLSENIESISPASIQARAVYCSYKLKKQVVDTLLNSGYTLPQAMCYILPNLSALVTNVQNQINTQPISATTTFNNGKFAYTPEINGICLDTDKLYQTLYSFLSHSVSVYNPQKFTFYLPTLLISAPITLAQLKSQTVLRGSFSTTYNPSNVGRSSNIALALSRFNNMVIPANTVVSFNNATGARTADNGYKQAKIIVNGKYVDGYGGGVCQASTTLYNALLCSDIQVLTRQPHSLVSGYIAPSFDATVSGSALDLVFSNQTEQNLYICADAKQGVATVKIYGLPNPYQIKRISQTVETYPAKTTVITDDGKYADKVTYTDQQYIISRGSNGLKSKAYLHYYKDGKFLFEKYLHTDTYKSTETVIVKGNRQRPPQYNLQPHLPDMPQSSVYNQRFITATN